MRLRKAVIIFGICILLTVVSLFYLSRDFNIAFAPSRSASISDEYQHNKWLHFEDRLKQLESDLSKHHEAVGEMRQAIQFMLPSPPTQMSSGNATRRKSGLAESLPASEMIYDTARCALKIAQNHRTDVQMLRQYEKIKFDNVDGGPWKQGWRIEVDERMWNKQHKLKVFVVPHSHNDPGWIKTFEDYYQTQTKHILDNMLEKLGEDSRRKFIWAEISYFAVWWDDIDQKQRDLVKKYVRTNQLEFVTGGWVMNDEANSHWISIVHQLTEGHQWLHKHLNYTPTTSWAIDPFGMSPTQPALFKGIGIDNILIQRVHYSVKKELAAAKQLEFRWRQTWDGVGSTDVFTHLMPFYSYDVPHTCGPDPKVCCQFDFARLPGYGITCPWRIAPQKITATNVQSRAVLLLDQYRKKSQLYKTNVLLVPLGDDFRYSHTSEWDAQYNNYQQLFDYMNANVNLHVQIQFGTLNDYFKALHSSSNPPVTFPTLSGDFFTYADRDDHYWSGYYTSRPFYKRMDRILLSYIRSAEAILTLAHISGKPGSKWVADKNEGMQSILTDARQALSLFQHHDGVTGTSKDHVMRDYGQKLLAAILNCQNIIQRSANVLLSGPGSDVPGSDTLFYKVDDARRTFDAIAEQETITIGPELSTKKIVIFNALTFTRHEVVTFFVSTPYIQVTSGLTGKLLRCQIAPVFEHGSTMSTSKYQVSFLVNVPALALVSYVITALTEHTTPQETIFSNVKVYNEENDLTLPVGFENVETFRSATEFTIQNARVTASFNDLGLLKALRVGDTTYPVHLDFATYGVRPGGERSGAYLFLPDGEAQPLRVANTVVKVIEGPIYATAIVELPYTHHVVTLYNSTGADGLGLEIQNTVDIDKTSNLELVMRFLTNIKSNDDYFSDVNGYQESVIDIKSTSMDNKFLIFFFFEKWICWSFNLHNSVHRACDIRSDGFGVESIDNRCRTAIYIITQKRLSNIYECEKSSVV